MKANQMNGLYPIIRRVRRPLVPAEGTAGGADAKPAEAPKNERPAPKHEAAGDLSSGGAGTSKVGASADERAA